MTTPDVHTLTGAYAADALPDEERRAFDAHLAECPACAQEVAELRATAARLAAGTAETPPPALRERVLAQARQTRQVSPLPVVSTSAPAAAPTPRAWYRQPLAAAAALLLIVALGLGAVAVRAERRADDAQRQADRISALLTDPGRVVQGMPVTTGGRAAMVAADGDAIFTARGLRALPANRSYQLWVIDEQGARSAGVLGRAGDGRLERFVTGIRPGDSMGLTVEPASGSEAPTTDPIWLASSSA